MERDRIKKEKGRVPKIMEEIASLPPADQRAPHTYLDDLISNESDEVEVSDNFMRHPPR